MGHFTQVASNCLLTYLQDRHILVNWHTTLNNHASTRPKECGDKTVPSVRRCKSYKQPGSASASWQCTLDLPNSYVKDDGIRLCVTSEGPSKETADENACRLAFAHLLMDNPREVLLRPKHWRVSQQDLIKNLPAAVSPSQALLDQMPVAVPPPQALPVHANLKKDKMKREAGTQRNTDPPHVWRKEVATLLRAILTAHAGTFDPSWIHHSWMGRRSGHEHMYEKLNKLLKPGELRDFVDKHPEFIWQHHGKNGMVVKWAW